MNTHWSPVQFKKNGIALILVWSCILAVILLFIVKEHHEDTIKEATSEARNYHELNLQYRRWVASVGGVYVHDNKVAPNPYLIVPDRDVKTTSGKSLTLINPAYMTRMVFETIQRESKNPVISRLVSIKPLNPANAPNAWELEALYLFEKGKVKEKSQVLSINNKLYLQFMAAFMTEKSCLNCHAHQGYKVGDVRGGMSISVPMDEYLAIENERSKSLDGGFALLWFLGTAGIAISSRRRHQQEMILSEHSGRIEAEIIERRLTQKQLEEQAVILEEEGTELQQAVVALQKTEQFLNTIIESEPECIKLLDADCNLLLMNRAGLAMIDADSLEQLKGQCVLPLVCESYREDFADLTRKIFLGTPGNMEFEISGLKGRKIWMSTTAVPFRDGTGAIVAALCITRNITELKRSEEALRTSENRFTGIAESLADWIWEVDAAGRFTFSSESSARILGYSADEITGKTVYELIDPQDVDRIKELLIEHAREKTAIKNLEHWNITKDGTRVCLLSNGVPILDQQGELIGYRGVDSDVTEQRMLERQASQQQKLESIGLLAGGIAHDFNNLLVPIFGYAEMINVMHSADEKTSSYSSTILNAAEKARDLIKRLLSFSKKQTLLVETLDLNEVITSFMMILQRTIRESIDIILKLSLEPCMVLADRTQIEQVLLNLAVNAQDAIDLTGSIKIETGHLAFDNEYCLLHPGTVPGRYVMIAFSDTGSGIDEATLPYIFDPFFTTKPTGHGTGLGLSTIFGVVKQHEGSIAVDSRRGVGTTFTLFFPEGTGDEERQIHDILRNLDKQIGTILVVEDNPMVLNMIREILEGAGHRVITADEPLKALEIVKTIKDTINLLVSDVVMPQMNGPELYDRITLLQPELKVLFMSGYAGIVSAHKGHLKEENNFISKPFTMQAFLRKVSDAMVGNFS
jgi:PAS domain S-box-containing protein